jgi:hypothetical protein
VLRALRKLLRPGGRIVFTTIYVAEGLTPALRRRARRNGPRAVASRRPQRALLTSAGFVDVDELDLTAEFVATSRAWIDESAPYAELLAAAAPPGDFAERSRERLRQLRATEDGLLRRGLFSARRPVPLRRGS